LNLLHWFLCRLSSITSSVHQGTGLLLKQTKSIPYHVLEEKYHAWTFLNKKEEINKFIGWPELGPWPHQLGSSSSGYCQPSLVSDFYKRFWKTQINWKLKYLKQENSW
jgi:hypothetical protein